MRSATAALTLVPGLVMVHPGPDVHFHDLGIEHAVLFAVVLGVLVFAVRK